MKTGIFGGTFNPVHLGHLAVCEAARAAHGLGGVPAQPQEQPLRRAQRFPDLAVARRGAGLPRQRGELRGLLFDHVVDARQVLLGPLELQLRLVATLVEPGDAGGFLQDDGTILSLFGGDFNFYELKLNFRGYHPVSPTGDWLIFKYNGTLGHLGSTDGSIVPYIHRYRAGGMATPVSGAASSRKMLRRIAASSVISPPKALR